MERPSEREKAAAMLSLIERELALAKTAEHKAAAEERLVGIKRALGSVAVSLEDDLVRVGEAKAAYEAAISRANDRYRQTVKLSAEAAALCDRFNLPTANLPIVVPPAMRKLSTQPVSSWSGISVASLTSRRTSTDCGSAAPIRR